MAKKKRKNRRPVAPRVHSAPGTPQRPASPATPTPARPEGPAAPPAPTASAASQRRERPQRTKAAARRRRSRMRTYLILGAVVALIVGAVVANRVISGRETAELNRLGRAAGCAEVRETEASGASEHLSPGETTDYDTSPPTHGEHSPSTLRAGVYDQALSEEADADISIYRAVHSLEHGAVIVWHDGLSDEDRTELEREYRNEDKVIVAPYPDLRGDTHVALSAWGFLATCDELSTDYVDAFIDRYRSARTAPEPNNAI